jgi:hypothetical protein
MLAVASGPASPSRFLFDRVTELSNGQSLDTLNAGGSRALAYKSHRDSSRSGEAASSGLLRRGRLTVPRRSLPLIFAAVRVCNRWKNTENTRPPPLNRELHAVVPTQFGRTYARPVDAHHPVSDRETQPTM